MEKMFLDERVSSEVGGVRVEVVRVVTDATPLSGERLRDEMFG